MSEQGQYKIRDFYGNIVTVSGPKEVYEPMVDAGAAVRALPQGYGKLEIDLIYGGWRFDPPAKDQDAQEKCYGELLKLQRDPNRDHPK